MLILVVINCKSEICVSFHVGKYIRETSLQKIVLSAMAATPGGGMAVGCNTGGIHIFFIRDSLDFRKSSCMPR